MDVTLQMALSRFKGDESFAPAEKPWAASEFTRLYRETDCRLPLQYRELLSAVGNFNHGFGYHFLARWEDGLESKHEAQVFLALPQGMIDNFQIFNRGQEYPGRFPLNMVFFGTADAGHTHLLANGSDETDNAVYLWGAAIDPWGEGENAQGLARCADTLFEFLHGLSDWDSL